MTRWVDRETELLVNSILALKKACRDSHKGGPGGCAICICGAAGGGSDACRALRVFSQWVERGELPEETMRILKAYL